MRGDIRIDSAIGFDGVKTLSLSTADEPNVFVTVSHHAAFIHRRPDTAAIAAASEDSSTTPPPPPLVLAGHTSDVSAIDVSSNKQLICTADNTLLAVWNRRGECIATYDDIGADTSRVLDVCFTQDSAVLYALIYDTASNQTHLVAAELATATTSSAPRISLRINIPFAARYLTVNAADAADVAVYDGSNVLFVFADIANGRFRLSQRRRIKSANGRFSSNAALHIANTNRFIAATDAGAVAIFDADESLTNTEDIIRSRICVAVIVAATKIPLLSLVSITSDTTTIIAVGCGDGAVRFFDVTMRLIFAQQTSVKRIQRISHAAQQPTMLTAQRTRLVPIPMTSAVAVPPLLLVGSDRIVTTDATSINAAASPLPSVAEYELMSALTADVTALAADANDSILAVGTARGRLIIYDTEQSTPFAVAIKDFVVGDELINRETSASALVKATSNNAPRVERTNIAFIGVRSRRLAVHFADGLMAQYQIHGIQHNTALQCIHVSRHVLSPVTLSSFSADGRYYASAAADRSVSLYQLDDQNVTLLGINSAHTADVVALIFTAANRLFSVDSGSRIVEYDIQFVSLRAGLRVKAEFDVATGDEFCTTTAATIRPRSRDDSAECLLFAKSDGKCALFAIERGGIHFRRLYIAPPFAGPIRYLLHLDDKRVLFASRGEFSGIMQLGDGADDGHIGMITAPQGIVNIAIANAAQSVFAVGRSSRSILCMKIGREETQSLLRPANRTDAADIIAAADLYEIQRRPPTLAARGLSRRILVSDVAKAAVAAGASVGPRQVQQMIEEAKALSTDDNGAGEDEMSFDVGDVVDIVNRHRAHDDRSLRRAIETISLECPDVADAIELIRGADVDTELDDALAALIGESLNETEASTSALLSRVLL